jgi:outer membrane protein assembly factor BamB
MFLHGIFLWIAQQNAASVAAEYVRTHRAADAALVSGEFTAALANYVRCLELAPKNATCAYAIACVKTHTENQPAALEWLERAVQWGYADAEVAAWDADLAKLRGDPRLAAALERMRKMSVGRNTRPMYWDLWAASVESWPTAIAVNKSGSAIAIGDADGIVRVLEAQTGRERVQAPSLGDRVWAVGLDPDSEHVLALTWNGKLHRRRLDGTQVWVSTTAIGPAAQEQEGAPALAGLLQWDPTGRLLLVAGTDRGASVFGAGGEMLWSTRTGFGDCADVHVTWSPDGKWLAAIAEADKREVRFLDAQSGADSAPALPCPDDAICVAIHPNREWIATGHEKMRVRVFDRATHALRFEAFSADEIGFAGSVNEAQFSPDGNYLAISTGNGRYVTVLDAATGERVWASGQLGGRIAEHGELVWSMDSQRLWSAFSSGALGLYEFELPSQGLALKFESANAPVFGEIGSGAVLLNGGYAALDPSNGEVLWVRLDRSRYGAKLIALFDPKRQRAALAGVPVLESEL